MNEIEKSKRLRNGPVYLLHDFEEVVLKCTPGTNGVWSARKHGGEEYEILSSTNLATEAWMEFIEMTEKEYNEF